MNQVPAPSLLSSAPSSPSSPPSGAGAAPSGLSWIEFLVPSFLLPASSSSLSLGAAAGSAGTVAGAGAGAGAGQLVPASANTIVVPFLMGMVAGQVLLIATILTLLWYLLLRPKPSDPSSASQGQQQGQQPSSSAKGKLLLSNASSSSSSASSASSAPSTSRVQIRISKQSEKAFFHALHEQSFKKKTASEETCVWLNVLVARLFHDITSSDVHMEKLLHFIRGALNTKNPPFLGPVTIESLVLSDAIPILESVAVNTNYDPLGETPLDLDAVFTIDYQGEIALTCNTSLVLNWPVPGLASASVSATVHLTHLRGKVQIHFPCPLRTVADPDAPENAFSFSFVEEPQFTFTAETAVGDRVHLSSEKLASILTTNIRKALINKCVQPAKISFQMFPDLAKQRKLQSEAKKLLEQASEPQTPSAAASPAASSTAAS